MYYVGPGNHQGNVHEHKSPLGHPYLIKPVFHKKNCIPSQEYKMKGKKINSYALMPQYLWHQSTLYIFFTQSTLCHIL